jgi:hypothetical protein
MGIGGWGSGRRGRVIIDGFGGDGLLILYDEMRCGWDLNLMDEGCFDVMIPMQIDMMLF